jgi:uncharacterized protein (DUF433 family)
MTLPDFLTRLPDGEILLTGHRIGLYTVVRCAKEGQSAEQIAAEFPTLRLALVQQVLTFVQANQAEVDAYFEAVRAEIERQAAAPQPGPDAAELRRRWQVRGLGPLP